VNIDLTLYPASINVSANIRLTSLLSSIIKIVSISKPPCIAIILWSI